MDDRAGGDGEMDTRVAVPEIFRTREEAREARAGFPGRAWVRSAADAGEFDWDLGGRTDGWVVIFADEITGRLDVMERNLDRASLFGVSEIAGVLGLSPQLIAQWHKRGKLPPATWRLAMGPVWAAEDIEPWLRIASLRV